MVAIYVLDFVLKILDARFFYRPVDDTLGRDEFEQNQHLHALDAKLCEYWQFNFPPEHKNCKLKNIDNVPDIFKAVSEHQAKYECQKRKCRSPIPNCSGNLFCLSELVDLNLPG